METRRPHLDPGEIELIPPPSPEVAMAEAAQRFDLAVAQEPGRGGRDADREVLRALREAEITAAGRVVYSSNAVFVLQLDAPDPFVEDEPMRAIYKPRRGERPLWDFARSSLHLREVAAYLFDTALGTGLVPPTTLRRGPHGPGSVQLFINGGDEQPEPEALQARLLEVATFDALVNNADRKRAHLLLGQGASVWCIDNALTFLAYPRQRTVLLELGGTPAPDAVMQRVHALLDDEDRLAELRANLGQYIETAEMDATVARLRELAADPVLPTLDPWDGRPWEGW